MLVGTTFLSLKSLSYVLDTKVTAKIFSSEGAQGTRGTIDVSYRPCAEDGVGEVEDDVMCDEPEELVGKQLDFVVMIDKCNGLPSELCKNVFVEYRLKHEPEIVYRTETCAGMN